MSLNAKQKKFCEILVTKAMSGSAAYQEVYKTKNSETAKANASKLLTNPNVSEYIHYLQSKATTEAIMTRKEVLIELSRLGRASFGNIASWSNAGLTLKDSAELSDAEQCTVMSVKETTTEFGGSLEIKQYDKIKPLESLLKHYENIDGRGKDPDTGDGETSVSRVLKTIRKLKR